jgi:hypothetical protein
MNTLTVKIPFEIERELEQTAGQGYLTKSAELISCAIAARVSRESDPWFVSALEQAGDVVGRFSGGPADLATNSKHLEDFGRV